MRKRKWLIALGALMASGLIAAGCGDDDATTPAETTTAEETTSDDSSAGRLTPQDVYDECIDVIEGSSAIEGTPREEGGRTLCEQARDAYEACITDAEEGTPAGEALDLAVLACEDAADQATEALEAAV